VSKKPKIPGRQDDAASEHYFPIRTVSTLTGVNTVTIRAWERRYGLIQPARTPSGHRLYTRTHVDLINRIVALLDRGIPVSRVREALAARAEALEQVAPSAEPWNRYLGRMIAGIERFQEAALEATYNEALALYPLDLVTRHLLLPLLEALGRRWQTAEGSVAEEHFFGVYLRNKLGARFHHRRPLMSGPTLLCACLPGEQHELGLLLFALSAHDAGMRCVLLGANLPLNELPIPARRAEVQAIVLSSSMLPMESVLHDDLPALVRAVAVPVFVGGLTSVTQRDAIVAAGANALGSDIPTGVRRLAEHLKHSATH
jgi:DNA-binding transcriptional MerR regulator